MKFKPGLFCVWILGADCHVTPAPHCVTTDLGATSSLQVGASIPFFLIQEYDATISPPELVKKHWEIDQKE